MPLIRIFPEKKFIGKHLEMSMKNNRTGELWKDFMMTRNEIKNAIWPNKYSIQIYNNDHNFTIFNLETVFEKWAAVEVESFDFVPVGFEKLIIEEGTYAVFSYKGSETNNSIFEYIFGEWLPNSVYTIDTRPHFEILGEKYNRFEADSEEEIWVPVKEAISKK